MAESGPTSWSARSSFHLGLGGLVVSGMALIAMLIGLAEQSVLVEFGFVLGVVASILGSLPAAALGAIGLVDTRLHPELRGREKAWQGLLLGLVGGAPWWILISLAMATRA